MSEKTIPIPGRLKNVAIGGHVAGSEDIDAGGGKTQKQVNDETNDTLALHQSEISGLNSQNYVSVSSYSSLPATGSANTIYRVSSWDGNANSGEGAADVTKYTEYAWNGTTYIVVSVKTQIGEVFDISEYKAVGGTLATFEDLSAALDSGNNVPAGIRKGGMSVKFVQSSDNKYMQCRLMSDEFTTDVTQWQGVDDVPTIDSKNFAESNGVALKLSSIVPCNFKFNARNGSQGNTGNAWVITLYGYGSVAIPVNAGQKLKLNISKTLVEGYNYYYRLVTYSTKNPNGLNDSNTKIRDFSLSNGTLISSAIEINEGEYGISLQVFASVNEFGVQDAEHSIALRVEDFSDGEIALVSGEDLVPSIKEVVSKFPSVEEKQSQLNLYTQHLAVANDNCLSGTVTVTNGYVEDYNSLYQVNKDLIPISNGQTIWWYSGLIEATLQACVYDASGNYLGNFYQVQTDGRIVTINIENAAFLRLNIRKGTNNACVKDNTTGDILWYIGSISSTEQIASSGNDILDLTEDVFGIPYRMRNGSQGNVGNPDVITIYGKETSAIPVKEGQVIKVICNKQLPQGYSYYYRLYTYSRITLTNLNEYYIRNESDATGTPIDTDIVIQSGEKGLSIQLLAKNSSGTFHSLRIADFAKHDIVVGLVDFNPLLNRINEVAKTSGENIYSRNRDRIGMLVNSCLKGKESNSYKKAQYLICTDSHGWNLAVKNAVEATNKFETIDAFVHCGDIVPSHYSNTAYITEFFNTIASLDKQFYIVVGNHDVGNSKNPALCCNHIQAYNTFIKPMVDAGILVNSSSHIEYQEGKPYWYHDDATYKLRLIGLYEYDDNLDIVNGEYRVLRGMRVIRQEQAEWFLNTLSETPTNYGVVVLMHNPFSDDALSMNEKFSWPANALGSNFSQNCMQTSFIRNAIKAFIHKESYSENVIMKGDASYLNVLSDGGTDYAYAVSKDFSQLNNGVYFIGLFGGHSHLDIIWKDPSENIYQITPNCAIVDGENDRESDVRRTREDGPAADSLTVVSVSDKRLGLVKLGVNVTDRGTMRDYEILTWS